MITTRAFAGRHYAVLGLARSGRASVASLLAGGAHVTAWDASPDARAALAPAERLLMADPLAVSLRGMDGVVVSPGVPVNTHPISRAAAEAGVPLIGDIELFAKARPALPAHRVVAITGTNGKSTTSALIAHLCRSAGLPTVLGGNIGDPVLAQTPAPAGGVYVLELSSFQIDLTQSLACDIAGLTNVTPDHLDRYDDMAAYVGSKARLFAMQGPDDVAVMDQHQPGVAALVAAHSVSAVDGSAGSLDGALLDDLPPSLAGPHNRANAALAVHVARALGLGDAVIRSGLAGFGGLPHRMEQVRTVGGVRFVNDSKATNGASVVPALRSFDRVHWIVGGQAKDGGVADCLVHLDGVVAAYTIGEAGDALAHQIGSRVPVVPCGTLDVAVARAARAARTGDTVLLAPACASYDQFSDYADRGRAFVAAVTGLALADGGGEG